MNLGSPPSHLIATSTFPTITCTGVIKGAGVGCAYRHPKASQESFDYINDTLKEICLRNKYLFLLGDLNDDLLRGGNKLKTIINTNKLHQVIDRPTKVTSESATLLDIVVTNKSAAIIHKDVIPKIVANHDLITATINITKFKRVPETITFRHHGSYSKESLYSALLNSNHTLNEFFSTDDVNAQADTLTSVMIACLDQCAPTLATEIKKTVARWITDEIRLVMATRNALQSRLKRDRYNVILQEQYKRERNRVKSLLREAEQT